MQAADLIALTPPLLLVGAGVLVVLLGGAGVRRGGLSTLTLAALFLSGIYSVASVLRIPFLEYVHDSIETLPKEGLAPVAFGVYEATPWTVLFTLLFLSVAFLVVLASRGVFEEKNEAEYYALLLLSTAGMVLVAGARELVTLFVGLELASFSTYALVGWLKKEKVSAEASAKYFIVGALSSAMALYGISLLYALSGTTQIAPLSGELVRAGGVYNLVEGRGSPVLIFAWVFVLVGFAFKVTAVPFHMWAIDAYDGAPTPVSAFLAAGSKKMGFAALFKIFVLGLFAVKASWTVPAALLALVTMTVGNLIAISQDNLKRMLAYSSVAQAGYILIALPISTPFALAGGLFHSLTHAVMTSGAFLALAAAARSGVGETLPEWRGLSRRAPFLAFSMAVFLLGFAGIPPLAGFASKFVLFSAAVGAGNASTGFDQALFYALAFAGVVNSVISLYYYARLIRAMYVEEGPSHRLKLSPYALSAVGLALLLTILLGIWPGPFVEFAARSATYLSP